MKFVGCVSRRTIYSPLFKRGLRGVFFGAFHAPTTEVSLRVKRSNPIFPDTNLLRDCFVAKAPRNDSLV